jgi:hypothetical protein
MRVHDSDRSRRRAQSAVVAAALVALSCGGDGNPAAPPGAAPVAASSAASTSGACRRLGLGDPDAVCGLSGPPKLLPKVETAIDLLLQYSPQLFDTSDVSAPNTELYKVLDTEGYLDGVVANLRVLGVCSQRDPHDPVYERILAKTSSESSETYDVLTSDGYIRRGNGSFVDSCSPASFPLERAPETPPPGSGCKAPYPPPVSRIACTVHMIGPEFDTLDSTPLVGPNEEYCAAIGYTDGRSMCPIRPPGAPDRFACEAWRVGAARDTGRPGPTWRKSDGSYCTGPDSGCQNSPDNQFQLWAYASGSYKVEAENGVSCVVSVDR